MKVLSSFSEVLSSFSVKLCVFFFFFMVLCAVVVIKTSIVGRCSTEINLWALSWTNVQAGRNKIIGRNFFFFTQLISTFTNINIYIGEETNIY